MGLLMGLVGGCWGKSKEQAAVPAERIERPVINNELEPVLTQGQPVIGVLTQVKQEVITTSDVLSDLAEPLTELGQQAQGQQFRNRAWQMIRRYLLLRREEILLLDEAEKGLDEGRKNWVQMQTEGYRQKLLRECNNSQTLLRNKLRAEGTTLEKELENYRRGLVVQIYRGVHFNSRINISRQDIVDYYKRHHERYKSPMKVELLKIQIITAKHSQSGEGLGEAQEQARQIAQEAWDELSGGGSFEQVARKYSDVYAEQGGNLGLVNPANLIEAKERQAIEKLKKGEYSGVLQNAPGYCIISIAKIIPASQTPLEEVQKDIEQTLGNEQYKRLRAQRVKELGRQVATTYSLSAKDLVLDLAQQQFERRY